MKSKKTKKIVAYDPLKIESKWQRFWLQKKTFETKNKGTKKLVLVEFPYPSGAGLHMGHMRPFIAGDVTSKYFKMKGFNTMYPIGWDAFGLPAENYAIKNKVHPRISTAKNVANSKKQLLSWGTGYDWSREINTTDPEYYKWTQKLFLEFYDAGLAYEKFGEINWCPKDKTGLANEEVIDGKCARCDAVVEKKNLRQWYLKITDYAEKLLEGLKDLKEWPEPIKLQQENWIGKSEGSEIDFALKFNKKDEAKPNYLILHGYTGRADKNFIPDLKKKLEDQGFEVEAPQLPNTNEPKESEQVDFVINNCKIDEKTILIGHSLGAAVAMKVIQKINHKVAGLVLVAPVVDPNFFKSNPPRPFWPTFTWNYDYEKLKSLTNFRVVLSDVLEKEKRGKYLKFLSEKLDAPIKESTANKCHFTGGSEPFVLKNLLPHIPVFTTRADTLFGATYLVLAPEHLWVTLATDNNHHVLENKAEVKAYVESVKNKTDIERGATDKEKTGVEIRGVKAINPATGEEIPMFVADYVLASYGTGAVMAVPAHDERDFEFAKKYGLPSKGVIDPGNMKLSDNWNDKGVIQEFGSRENIEKAFENKRENIQQGKTLYPYEAEGDCLINSGKFNGMDLEEAKSKITEFVVGRIVTKYKLRDWVFSRQRYWGEPIPLLHCPKCGIVPVADKDLPVKLPEVKNYEPTGTGESPLAGIDKWVNVKCPKCTLDSKKTKYLVFDFDGVIGDTYDACLKTYVGLGFSKNIEEAKKRMIKFFSRHPEHFKRNNEINKEDRKKLLKERHQVFGNEQIKYKLDLFTDFVSEIKKIKNIKVALVSAGTKIYIEPTIKKSKLKFDCVYCAEDSFSKIEKIEWIAKKWKVGINDIYYFTDTKSDVFELENDLDRKKIIGCAWGYLGYDSLKEVLPENQILKNFKDIHKLFKICDAKRETNTMPQWAGSSWYWLRYMDPKNKKEFANKKLQKYWSPVDLYFGGMEHTTLHLLYSRFWNLFFYDRGLVTVKEPYKKRVPHGLILAADGDKMSKSKGNFVNPDDFVKLYGADTVRLYMMFLGPHGASVAWNDKGIVGTRRFLERAFAMREMISKSETPDVTIALHKAIKKVTEDIETFSFNTAVSTMMIFVNTVYESKNVTKKTFEAFLQLLAPFAPHLTEELWHEIGNRKSIYESKWPNYREDLIKSEKVTVVVQVNGKNKAELSIDRDIDDKLAEKLALENEKVSLFLANQQIKRIIVVKNRLINIVI